MATNDFTKDISGLLPVWTWECDLEGIYTACSPEITQCLGIPPEQLINQSIYSTFIHPDTASLLTEIVVYGKFPSEINAQFLSSQGKWVNGKINIFELKDKKGELKGWHGFNQIVLTVDSFPLTSSESSKFEPGISQNIHSDSGIAIEHGKIQPAVSFWSMAGNKALESGQTVVSGGKTGALAVPFKFGNYGSGVIEVFEEAAPRVWTPDERRLVEEVAQHLETALERHLLKGILEKEILDRSRAEEEILRRNQELVKLYEIGQQLGRLSSPQEVFNYIFYSLADMIDNRNMIITIIGQNKNVTFPLFSRDGQMLPCDSNPFAASIFNYVTREKSPLLITGQQPSEFLSRQVILPAPIPSSLIAVPLLAGDRPIGAIILQNFENESAYNFIHLQLLSTIATQITAALENVHLFQQIRDALNAIEIREHYQANIALAVTSLSQNGSQSLGTVLELIGQAARCSQVVFIQKNSAETGPAWLLKNSWPPIDPGAASKSITPHYVDIDYDSLLAAIKPEDGASSEGWKTGKLALKPGSSENSSAKIDGSFLLLVIHENTSPGSFIILEQFDRPRVWKNEEINILKLAANALSNTLIREELLVRLQDSLGETESLYNASHELALQNEPQQMLAAISSHLSPIPISKTIMVRFVDYDLEPVKHMDSIAVWQNNENRLLDPQEEDRFPEEFLSLFLRSTPVFFDDIRLAPVDDNLSRFLLEHQVLALGIIPLWSGKRQLGLLALCSNQPYQFTSREKRTYPPLVDQMANAIENVHAYELSQQAVREMKEVDRLKSHFLATMTHELRSPLNAIIGFSQVILKGIDGPVNDLQGQDLTAIYDSGQLLLSLINDVLDLSKIEAGRMDLSFSEFNLEDIIDSGISTTHGLLKNKAVELVKELSPLPVITADPIRIRQVLINLLSNAAKFTETGTIKVKAWAETAPEGSQSVWVTVSDTGIGMTAEDQKKIFKPFTQVDSYHSRKAGGSGLGLSICHSLIELHHGQIGIQHSAPDQGSTFYFTIPVKQLQ